MSLADLKLAAADFSGQNIKSLPDKVQSSASSLKTMFDNLSEAVIAPRINEILDLLAAEGATEIGGAALYEGDTEGSVQSKLAALYAAIAGVALGSIPNGSITKAKLDTAAAAGLLTFSTVAPEAGDDVADGYQAGCLWMDTTALVMYVCRSAAAGAAVWEAFKTGASGLAGSSTFNGSSGRVITHNLGSTAYAVCVTPTADTEAKAGEIYAVKAANTVTVYNSGTFTGAFDYIIMEV